MADGISIREFARREECDEALVRRKIKSGHLLKLDNGKLDPALVGTNWRRGNEADSHTDKKLVEVAKDIITDNSFVMLTKAEAEQKKENYLALLRELEYDEKAGLVVAIEDVMTVVAQQLARVRNKVIGIPTRCAPKAAILTTAEEIEALLMEVVVEVLGELTADGPDFFNTVSALQEIAD